MSPVDAVVVGSGPNGLAAAITLARAGRSVTVLEGADSIGGGVRSEELTLPGFLHDPCSAVHALAVASPFLRNLPLAEHGLEWIHPEVPLAHPTDDGSAAVLARSIEEMCAQFPADGARYRRLFEPFARDWAKLSIDLLQPVVHWPKMPVLMARFGLASVLSAQSAARRFKDPGLQALFAGCAGHAILPLDKPLTASFALVLITAAHAAGWPIPRGGSQALSDAMASYLRSLGGEILTGRMVRSLEDLPPHRVVLFDVAPTNLLAICGERMGGRYRRQLLGYHRGESVFKVDYALSAPVPWTAEACHRAGTVHVGGTLEEIAAAEHDVASGRLPERPLVLASQPTAFDPTRAPAGHHVLWAYTHVPGGSEVDVTASLEAQIERFAPGFRETILARSTRNSRKLQEHNPNLVGGDITGGSNGGLQLFFRPRPSLRPYDTPAPGVYICSASTPPGGGVHGMCGYWAARRALKRELA